ncbi:MAG: FKBP-type peptidyl-prolyl cis-trans isomerase [Acidiferrobacterales bacterium]
MSIRIPLALALASVFMGGCAATSSKLTTDKQRLSYVVGYRIGENLKSQNMDIDPGALMLAIEDVEKGRAARLTSGQMRAAVVAFQHKREADQASLAQRNLETGTRFLAENGKKPGVVTLPSGLEYKVITAGKGRKPTMSDTVVANYRGLLIDGTEFDSSYKRGKPATFALNGVIPGWQQALQLMPVGSKWRVYIPASLAYGANGAGSVIGPNEALIFDIDLLKIK